MLSSSKICSLSLFVGLCSLSAAFCQQLPGEPSSAAEVDLWVEQLSSVEYQVRDQATHRLIAAGGTAVPAVADVLETDDLEAATRGIFILQELALSGDEPTEQSAQQVLQDTADNPARPVGRQARQALRVLDDLRQQRALRELAELGARIDPDYVEMGLTPTAVFAVQFGPQWRGETADLRRLRWLRDVEQIVFEGPQVTDDWIGSLEGMAGLTYLKIRRAQVSNAALAMLKDVPRLRNVKLLYVEIGDGAIPHLKRCQQIARLLAYGTNLSEAGAEQLRAAGLDVDLRKGAFLGISVHRGNDGENWFINQVTPASAADRSGLQPGDVIARFNEKAVRDFPSLMSMIADNDAGSTVTIEIRRGGDTFVKQITLGEWE